MSATIRNLMTDIANDFFKRINEEPVCMDEYLARTKPDRVSAEVLGFANAYANLWDAAVQLERTDIRFRMTDKELLCYFDRYLSPEQLADRYTGGSVGLHPIFTQEKWITEAQRGHTIEGYWDWVYNSLNSIAFGGEQP